MGLSSETNFALGLNLGMRSRVGGNPASMELAIQIGKYYAVTSAAFYIIEDAYGVRAIMQTVKNLNCCIWSVK